MRFFATFLCVLLTAMTPAAAESPVSIGTGRLFTNDHLGDGRDRWQSGSYVISHVRTSALWTGAPHEFGTVMEYRLRSAVMASDGRARAPGDRPYAGTISLGVHSHYGSGTNRSSFGFDVTVIGPQTGISRFQRQAHEFLSMPRVRFTDRQLGDDYAFGLTAETADVLALTDTITLRPFAEAQLGPEDLVRVGADAFFGGPATSELLLRDVTTGQLYLGTSQENWSGLTFVIGGDIAAVADSIYLPQQGRGAMRTERGRLRAGVRWHSANNTSLFYGLTYLSPEFDGQSQGQVTGSVKLNFNF